VNNPFYLTNQVLAEVGHNPKMLMPLEKLLFLGTGSFFLGNLSSTSRILSEHLDQGINCYNKFVFSKSFTSYSEKAEKLIELINVKIKSKKLDTVGIMLSGGKDSALLAKLLSKNGVKVNAYHAMRHEKNHPENRVKLQNLNDICTAAGVSTLSVVYGGVGPKQLLKSFNNRVFTAPAASGCANIFLNSNISVESTVCFAQGVDTLSNAVHTQHKYYNNSNLASLYEIKAMLRTMYTSTYPKFYKIIALRIINQVIKSIEPKIYDLKNTEVQNISRLIGMHLVHTPMDSKFFYDISRFNGLPVFNPFHSLEVEELYMQSIMNLSKTEQPGKKEIDLALHEFGMHKLKYDKSGFNVQLVSDQGQIVSSKEYYRLLFNILHKYYVLNK
jgi:ribosomal protein S13